MFYLETTYPTESCIQDGYSVEEKEHVAFRIASLLALRKKFYLIFY